MRTWALRVFHGAVWLLFFTVTAAPLAAAFWPETGLRESLRAIAGDRAAWRLLGRSAAIAAGTALGASLLGIPAGYLSRYLSPRFRAGGLMLLSLPLILPRYVFALAWIEILGAGGLFGRWISFPLYTPWGVIFVLSTALYPIPMWATAALIERIPRGIEEAARLYGGGRRALMHILLPLAAPGIALGAGAVFLLALLSFAIPSLYQVSVYPVEVYERFSTFHDTASALAAGLPLLGFGVLFHILWRHASRRWTSWSRPKNAVPLFLASPRGIRMAWGYAAALGAATLLLPLYALIRQAWPPGALWQAWRTAQDEILTSLFLATTAATAGTGLALCLTAPAARRKELLPLVSAAAFLVSGPVFGVGLIRLWNHHGFPGWVYDSVFILLLACLGRYLVFAHYGLGLAVRQCDPRLEEAAAVHGAGGLRRFWAIRLPILAPALALWWGVLFILAWGELDTVVLVAPPGWTPLPVRIFSLLHYGPSQTVAALCLASALSVAGPALAGLWVWRWSRKRAHA